MEPSLLSSRPSLEDFKSFHANPNFPVGGSVPFSSHTSSFLPSRDALNGKSLVGREITVGAFDRQMGERTEVTWKDLVEYKRISGKAFSSDKVVKLDLSGATLTNNEVLEILACFPNIHTLVLRPGCRISDQTLIFLGMNFPKLQSLDLAFDRFTRITDEGIKALEMCQDLQVLSIHDYDVVVDETNFFEDVITSQALRDLAKKCLRLYQLKGRTEVTWEDLVQYKRFRGEDFSSDEVVKLDLSHAALRDEDILEISARFPTIHTLLLNDMRNPDSPGFYSDSGNQTVIALAKKHPRLQTLNLTGCSYITDEGILALAENCPSLQALYLNRCCQVTDQGIIPLAKACRSLHTFEFKDCFEITDLALEAIAENCPLHTCTLSNCQKITSRGIEALAMHCLSLQFLTLIHAEITDQALIALAKCRKLHTLQLNWCKSITNRGVEVLVGCLNLHTLDITGCDKVTLDITELLNFFNRSQSLQKIISQRKAVMFRPTPTPASARALTSFFPTPPRAVQTSPIPSTSQNSSIKSCFHIFSTVVLGAIVSNVIGWKMATALSAVYLTHQFTHFFKSPVRPGIGV